MQVFQDWQEKEEERRAAMATTKAGQPGSAAHTQEQEETQFVAYVPLPDDQAIEALLVQKKKEDLMAKYASASLQREQEDAKSLLNKRS